MGRSEESTSHSPGSYLISPSKQKHRSQVADSFKMALTMIILHQLDINEISTDDTPM